MKKLLFSIEKDGFYGTYYENPHGSDCTVLGLFGDDPNDYMAKCGVKWLHKNGVNALCMSPGKKNYSHVNMPLERYAAAIAWLKAHGTRKIGVMGMSTAGMDSLAAASYFPDITLTFGLTASDFIWQGFEQGKKDGCGEWPVPGTSTLSWKGEPLPYMPFVYQHPEYWNRHWRTPICSSPSRSMTAGPIPPSPPWTGRAGPWSWRGSSAAPTLRKRP